ncbi:MAG TPA: hypothetical protein PKZ41_02695, partial [Candidatus Omnitrophota bacterium]|nr:hypothetical protein [Candidatus Omnitrophota bacterium]
IPHDCSVEAERGKTRTSAHVILETSFGGVERVIDTQLLQFEGEKGNKLALSEDFSAKGLYFAEEYYAAVPAYREGLCLGGKITSSLAREKEFGHETFYPREGLLRLRSMVMEKIKERSVDPSLPPVKVFITGQPGTGKSTITEELEAVFFGLEEFELERFSDDVAMERHYNMILDRAVFPEKKLVIIEGYHTIPDLAERLSPDIIVEIVAEDQERRERIRKRSEELRFSTHYDPRIMELGRIPYHGIDFAIDTTGLDRNSIRNVFRDVMKVPIEDIPVVAARINKRSSGIDGRTLETHEIKFIDGSRMIIGTDPVTGEVGSEEVIHFGPDIKSLSGKRLYERRLYGPGHELQEITYYDLSGEVIGTETLEDFSVFKNGAGKWMDMNPFVARNLLEKAIEERNGRSLTEEEHLEVASFLRAIFGGGTLEFINENKYIWGYPLLCSETSEFIHKELSKAGIKAEITEYGNHVVVEVGLAGVVFVVDGTAGQLELRPGGDDDESYGNMNEAVRRTGLVIMPRDVGQSLEGTENYYRYSEAALTRQERESFRKFWLDKLDKTESRAGKDKTVRAAGVIVSLGFMLGVYLGYPAAGFILGVAGEILAGALMGEKKKGMMFGSAKHSKVESRDEGVYGKGDMSSRASAPKIRPRSQEEIDEAREFEAYFSSLSFDRREMIRKVAGQAVKKQAWKNQSGTGTKRLFVGIEGFDASGKSYFVEKELRPYLKFKLGRKVEVLHGDWCMVEKKEREKDLTGIYGDYYNWFDHEKLSEWLKDLHAPETLTYTINDAYVSESGERSGTETLNVDDDTIVLVDGLFLERNDERVALKPLMDYFVYFNVTEDVSLGRQLERDPAKMGRTEEEVLYYVNNIFLRTHAEYRGSDDKPFESADIAVDNSDLSAPRVEVRQERDKDFPPDTVSEKKAAVIFSDTVKLAKDKVKLSRPVRIALGTDWIKGYSPGKEQQMAINP